MHAFGFVLNYINHTPNTRHPVLTASTFFSIFVDMAMEENTDWPVRLYSVHVNGLFTYTDWIECFFFFFWWVGGFEVPRRTFAVPFTALHAWRPWLARRLAAATCRSPHRTRLRSLSEWSTAQALSSIAWFRYFRHRHHTIWLLRRLHCHRPVVTIRCWVKVGKVRLNRSG